MSEIIITCPRCKQDLQASSELIGQFAECPSCGHDIQVHAPEQPPAISKIIKPDERVESVQLTESDLLPTNTIPPSAVNKVIITDVKIPFWSMVILMVKWSIAAIPAFIILSILGSILFGILFGGCAAMLGSVL